MYIKEIIDTVKAEFFTITPNTNEIISSINMVIRDLNINVQQIKELSNVFSDDTDVSTIDEDDDVFINLMDSQFINAIGIMNTVDRNGDYISGNNYAYQYDSNEYKLVLPNSIVGVLDIVLDDVFLQNKDYEYVKANVHDEYCYCSIGSVIYFSKDVLSTDLKIIAKLNYPVIQDEDEDYNYIPANAFNLFVYGALYFLSARPKYRDEVRYSVFKQSFDEARQNIVYTLNHLTPNKEFTKQYTW